MFTQTKAQANIPPLDLSGRTKAAGTPAYRHNKLYVHQHRCTGVQAQSRKGRAKEAQTQRFTSTITPAHGLGITVYCHAVAQAYPRPGKKIKSIQAYGRTHSHRK